MDHGEYISGGYYLTRRVPRRENMRPDLMPEQVLSASGCVCDFFPNTWAIEWVNVSDADCMAQAAVFGLDEVEMRELRWPIPHHVRQGGKGGGGVP